MEVVVLLRLERSVLVTCRFESDSRHQVLDVSIRMLVCLVALAECILISMLTYS